MTGESVKLKRKHCAELAFVLSWKGQFLATFILKIVFHLKLKRLYHYGTDEDEICSLKFSLSKAVILNEEHERG